MVLTTSNNNKMFNLAECMFLQKCQFVRTPLAKIYDTLDRESCVLTWLSCAVWVNLYTWLWVPVKEVFVPPLSGFFQCLFFGPWYASVREHPHFLIGRLALSLPNSVSSFFGTSCPLLTKFCNLQGILQVLDYRFGSLGI